MNVRHWIFLLFGVLASSPSYAIVNLKNLHLSAPEVGFSGTLSFGLNGSSGNSRQMRIKSGVLAQWYQPGYLNYITANYAYGKTFDVNDGRGNKIDVVDVDKAFAHLRHIHDINHAVAWEVFAQTESDAFTRLTYRGLAGGGARFSLLARDVKQAAFLGAGVLYSQEEIKDQKNATDSGLYKKVKGNLYFIFKKAIAENVVIQSTTYAQPVVSDLGDVRVLEDANLTLKVADSLALSLNVVANYNNRPPQQVKRADVIYSTAIEYEF